MSDCGANSAIWKTEMGDSGACNMCNPARPMSSQDKQRWVCNKGDIALNPSGAEWNTQTCMSWSTQGTCEFRQKDLRALQVSLKSKNCNGLWVAPLWIAPQGWQAPQHATGELDLFERGCSTADGYVTSFGESAPYILFDSWKEKNNPTASTELTAYVTFDPNADIVTTYKCPFGSNPISDGTGACQRTAVYNRYFKDSAGQTSNGTEYMRLVSDLWNKCKTLNCGHAAVGNSSCSFEVSNIQLRFSDESTQGGKSPFRDPSKTQCDSIWFKGGGSGGGKEYGEVCDPGLSQPCDASYPALKCLPSRQNNYTCQCTENYKPCGPKKICAPTST